MSFLVHPSQPEIQSLVRISEKLGLNAQLMKHGGMKITNMDHIFLRIVTQFIGISVR